MQEKIRPGYKQTDIGLVPEDWDVLLVDDLVMSGVIEKPMDGNHGAIHPKSSDFVDFGVPFVMANHVYQGVLDLDTCPHISRKQADSLQKGFARSGDILLTHKATIGETAIVGKIPFDYIMLTPQVTFYRVRMPEKISRDYLFHYFNGSIFQEHLKLLSGGGTRSYIGITAQRMLRVVLPRRIVEQNAIADALSDADARIAALEALIAKKRDIKQAAMQQLLTGKTRLPGFSGEWEVKPLGDLISAIGDGGTPATSNLQNFGGGVHWVVIDDIKPEIWTTKNSLSEAGLARCSAKLWPAGTLILSTGATIGEVGVARIPVATKQGICGIVFDPRSAHVQFMKYWFSLNRPLLLSKAQGSTIFEVRPPTLVKIEGLFPEVVEQTAIAEILSDMDAELASLDAEAEKARTIKQGMMQNLLTGKVRLV